jgi:tetratricopeptide (TPR) repeat protein
MENNINRKTSDGFDRQSVDVNLRKVQSNDGFSPSRFRPADFPRPVETPRERREEKVTSQKDSKLAVKMFDKVIGLSMIMLFFGLPLFFTGQAFQGIIFEKQMYFYFWLLLGLVAWAAKGVIVGEMNIRRTPLDFPILGFWLICLASAIFSVDRWHSFWGGFSDPSRGMMSLTAYVIAYYFVFSNFNLRRLKLVFMAILASGAVLSIWTLLAILGIKFLPDSWAAFSPMSLIGSVTGLGIFFTALVPLITVGILKLADNETMKDAKKKILTGLLFAYLALDLFLILALYDYVPWLGFFIGIVVLLIFILAKIVRPNQAWTWVPMAVFILAMILRMTGAVSIVKINLPVEVSLNYSSSLEVAKGAIGDNLLVGSGPATYGYAFSLYKPEDFNLNMLYNLRFLQGTGAVAEVASTLGILGIFFFFVLLLSYIGSQVYLMYKDKEKNKLYSLGLFSATAIVLTNVLSVRVDGAILAMFVLLATITLATSLLESDTPKNNLSLSLKASPKFALALAFVFMAVSAGVAFLFVYLGKTFVADVYAGRAASKISTEPENSLAYLGQVIKFNNKESKYYSQIGQYYMALANQEAAKDEQSRDIEKIQQYLNTSISSASISKNLSPNDVGIVESLALIYENAGLYVPDSLAMSEEEYKRAQKLEPYNPVYFIKLGQIKIAMAGSKQTPDEKKKLIAEAKDLFQKSIDLKSNYAEAYYQLALCQEALEEFDLAIENGSKAVQFNPKNSNYLLSLGRIHQSRNKGDDYKTAEKHYKSAIAINENDINGHFYLGLLYEKDNNRDGAKERYEKVMAIIKKNSDGKNAETLKQLQKMIENVNLGIKNTPESLGLIQEQANQAMEPENIQPEIQPANANVPTLDEVQGEEERN